LSTVSFLHTITTGLPTVNGINFCTDTGTIKVATAYYNSVLSVAPILNYFNYRIALVDGSFPINNINYTTIVTEATVASSPNATGAITIPSKITDPSTDRTYNVTSISENAFYNCLGLTFIEIPSSITTFGNYAFKNCSNLTSVTLTDGLTLIGQQAFYYSGLKSVTIPASITTWGIKAFMFCQYLTSVTLSPGLTTIGEDAFRQ
jgi:hypothetical protein